MRIVVAASNGAFAAPAVRAVAESHDVVAILRPARSARRLAPDALLRRIRRDPLTTLCREVGAHELRMRNDDALGADLLRPLSPDVLCILTFPWLLGPLTLAAPRTTCLNVHPSLLPRHRGPNPYFWQYYHGDQRGGLSVHVATASADAGPIWVQSDVPIARGYPVEALHADLSRQAALDLPLALTKVEAGYGEPAPQEEARASRAPRVSPIDHMIDFDEWSTERVWHLLKGMCPRYRERLADEEGRRVRYRAVVDWSSGSHARKPGSVTGGRGRWTLWCRDGRVELARRSAR